MDVNHDGFMDVTINTPAGRRGRQWSPQKNAWDAMEPAALAAALDEAAQSADVPEELRHHRPAGAVRRVDLDDDGDRDVILSDAERYAVYLFDAAARSWGRPVLEGKRGDKPAAEEPPPFVRADGSDNGAWFHSRHVWWQNEDTAKLPDLV